MESNGYDIHLTFRNGEDGRLLPPEARISPADLEPEEFTRILEFLENLSKAILEEPSP